MHTTHALTSQRVLQRRRHLSRAARLALEALEPRVLMSVTFATADNFQLVAGKDSSVSCMAADAAGNVYAGGAGTDAAGAGHTVIREKLAASATWTTILDIPAGSSPTSLVVDAAGNLYASTTGGWSSTIYEKLAGQSTFSVVDQITGASTAYLAVDAAGDVFASGSAQDSSSSYHWIVRERVAGTQGFAAIDNFFGIGAPCGSTGITVVNGAGPSAGIYVIGGEHDPLNGAIGHGIIRKSIDGGATWSTVDDFTGSQPGNLIVRGFTTDQAGNVYVTESADAQYISGYTTGKNKQPIYSTSSHWIVRKSASGDAGTWTTNDDYQLSTQSAVPWSAATDLAGNVYVAGYASDANGISHSIVRTNAGGTWQTVDNYQLASGRNAYGRALTVGSDGTLYAGSSAAQATAHNGSGGSSDWIIRSAAGPAPLAPAMISLAKLALQPAQSAKPRHTSRMANILASITAMH